jgi:hypothetical protein
MNLPKLLTVEVHAVDNGVLLTADLTDNPFNPNKYGPKYHASIEDALDTVPRVIADLRDKRTHEELERRKRHAEAELQKVERA